MWNPFKLIKKPFGWAWNKAKKKLAIMLIKRLIKELGMSELWEWFNGKKMLIGGVLLWLAVVLPGFFTAIGIDPVWLSQLVAVLTWLGGVLLPGGAIHKLKKAKS